MPRTNRRHGVSFLERSSPPVEVADSGKILQMYDFLIVIGGGGLLASRSLTSSRAPASGFGVLEGEARPGFHATGRSAALFAPSQGGPEIKALTRASRAFFDHPPPGFGEHPLLQPRGCLYLARSDQREHLNQMIANISVSGGGVVTTIEKRRRARSECCCLRDRYVAAAAIRLRTLWISTSTCASPGISAERAYGGRSC